MSTDSDSNIFYGWSGSICKSVLKCLLGKDDKVIKSMEWIDKNDDGEEYFNIDNDDIDDGYDTYINKLLKKKKIGIECKIFSADCWRSDINLNEIALIIGKNKNSTVDSDDRELLKTISVPIDVLCDNIKFYDMLCEKYPKLADYDKPSIINIHSCTTC